MKTCLIRHLAIVGITAAVIFAPISVSQTQSHNQHMAKHMPQHASAGLTQGGHGAFTALAKAVAQLEADFSQIGAASM